MLYGAKVVIFSEINKTHTQTHTYSVADFKILEC